MGINASEIFNTAIILDSRTIEEYLIDEQKKSTYSPQVFFGLLLYHAEQISISKKIEYLKGRVLDLTYELKIFDSEVAPTLSNWNREYTRTKKTKKLEEAKSKAINYKLFDEIVIRQLEISISGSEAILNTDGIEEDQEDQEVPLEYPFNRMPKDQVRLFFTPLIETENNEGDKWMSPESFEIFLRRSFDEEISLSKPEIKLGKGTKGAIIKLFYEFYSHSIDKNYSSKREKKPYVKLLMDAFNTGIFDNLDDDSFNGKADWDWPDFKSKLALFKSKLKP
jgi:hypothetical protein